MSKIIGILTDSFQTFALNRNKNKKKERKTSFPFTNDFYLCFNKMILKQENSDDYSYGNKNK